MQLVILRYGSRVWIMGMDRGYGSPVGLGWFRVWISHMFWATASLSLSLDDVLDLASDKPLPAFLSYSYCRWTMKSNPCCIVVAPASENFDVVFGLHAWVRWKKSNPERRGNMRKLYYRVLFNIENYWKLGCRDFTWSAGFSFFVHLL